MPDAAIVAVNVQELFSVTSDLLRMGVRKILVEKPAGISYEQVSQLAQVSEEYQANIFVAYNRRFYTSVEKLLSLVREDGGIMSFNFEFTEWGHKIKELGKKQEELENWFLLNSSHVIDLAFFIGGQPQLISSYVAGSTDWHPQAAVWVGSGVCKNNVLFSYHANWSAPGRWGIEIMTASHRFCLRPLEELYIQKLGSLDCERVEINDMLDRSYKPGLFAMVNAFLHNPNDYRLLSLNEHSFNIRNFEKMEKSK